jgi:hypothetical protein
VNKAITSDWQDFTLIRMKAQKPFFTPLKEVVDIILDK